MENNKSEVWVKVTKDNVNNILVNGQQLRYKIGGAMYGYGDDKRYCNFFGEIVDKDRKIMCSSILNAGTFIDDCFDCIEALTSKNVENKKPENKFEVIIQSRCYNGSDMYYCWYIPLLGIRSSLEYTRSHSAKRHAKKTCEKLGLSYIIE